MILAWLWLLNNNDILDFENIAYMYNCLIVSMNILFCQMLWIQD